MYKLSTLEQIKKKLYIYLNIVIIDKYSYKLIFYDKQWKANYNII